MMRNSITITISAFCLLCSCSYLALLLFVDPISPLKLFYLFRVVKTLEIVFTEKRAVFGFSTTRHTLAEIHPEVVASSLVPCYPPP
ncbi:hypothetical protein HanHA300_Chr06g0206881 [Helianthus annuus]|nr:hypothetical protein HanHA300_Chr06g0206881 [Helianthus annuus]KAJ0573018.1 hypothetical protein HanHA89_Chr06g0222121 [Helianthus annuus]KAJ0737453.1 hypothetical protein HanLR1_Chr06g0207181 [Helianthus annuus]